MQRNWRFVLHSFTVKMFDRVKLRISCVKECIITGNNAEFTRIKWEDTSDHFEFTYKNIKGLYYGATESVFLSGSLHKFYCGNNYLDFTYKDIIAAFNKIAIDFNCDLKRILIVAIEVAINVIPVKPVNSYYRCFISYERNSFIPMNPLANTSQSKGITCSSSTKNVKLYDKTFEATHNKSKTIKALVPDNILRIEIYLKARYLRQNKLRFTADQIMDFRIFNKYIKVFTLGYIECDKTNKYSVVDLNAVKASTMAHYYLIISDNYPIYLESLKAAGHPIKYENKRRKITLDTISKQASNYDYLRELEILFHNKRRQLSGVKNAP